MSTIPTNRESDRFMLRLPDGMRDRIKASAEANNRSMNAEIVATLEEKYPAPPEPGQGPYADVVRWNDMIAAAKSEGEARALVEEANKWLGGPGRSSYRIFLFKPSGADKWLPSIVHKDAIGANGIPEAFFFKSPPTP